MLPLALVLAGTAGAPASADGAGDGSATGARGRDARAEVAPGFTPLASFALPEAGTARVRVRPEEYSAYRVDVDAVADTLAAAPDSDEAGARGVRIELPDPAGGLHTFAVVEDSVMASGLQAAHPELRTFAGRDVDDPTRTVRLDVTPLGLHASVRDADGGGSWYVDPALQRRGATAHLAYVPTDDTAPLVESGIIAHPDGEAPAAAAAAAATAAGDLVTRRTYRLALVTDPSYAAYFGTQNVLAEKVTLINRVNQIYGEDFAIRLQLVDGTDDLNLDTAAKATEPGGPCGESACYDAADLDPETGGCSSGLLDRNEFVIGQIIGADRYDVGHIALGINGGGIAGLGVVGEQSKADGCTGLPFPEGDFMAIDYVAHELGHQFAANHTFDGDQANCSLLNRNGGTSVEPGSGSSVMAYAGICGTDDLQPHTDPYFSQRSIDEVTAHVTAAPGAYTEEQTVTLTGFDTDGETVNLGYDGRVTSIVRGAGYTVLGVQRRLRALTGAQVTVGGYDAGRTSLNDGGFWVRWPDTDAHPRLAVTGTSGDVSAFIGVPYDGGPGTNQGTATVTTNHAPTVTAPADATLPLRTPFTLTGSGSDPDGDALVYLWEQNDTGGLAGLGLVENTKHEGPLFRVFGTYADVSLEDSLTYSSSGENLADANPSRTFPDLEQILDGNTNAATGTCPEAPAEDVPVAIVECFSEFLPTADYTDPLLGAGSMTFRLTARDGRTAGGTQHDDVTLTVGDAGPFLVTSQSEEGAVTGGDTGTVTWDVAGTDAAQYAPRVRVSLSVDGGHSYPYELAGSTPNDGSIDVTWPQVETDAARVRVEAVGNYFFDLSDADLTIHPSLTVSTPAAARVQYSDVLEPLTVRVSAAEADGADLALAASGVSGLAVTRVGQSGAGTRPGTATFAVTGTVTQAVGAATLRLTASAPGTDGVSTSSAVTVQAEDASVGWDGPESVRSDGEETPVALRTVVSQADDGQPGDLSRALVTFVDRGTGRALCTTPADSDGTASCAGLVDTSEGTEEVVVGTVVSGDFARDAAEDDVVLPVLAGAPQSDEPTTRLTSGPRAGSFTTARTVRFGYSSDTEGVAWSCTLDGEELPCSAAGADVDRPAPGEHVFTVAAVAGDRADSTPATRTFLVPSGVGRLSTETTGWTRRTGAGFHRGHALVASRAGSRLSAVVRNAEQVAVVVTRAPGAGRVRIALGGTVLRTVRLAAPSRTASSLVVLPRFAEPVSGRLTLTTVGGRQVSVEGLGVRTR
ncbi:M12 family metallo-peptidase [Nocardioides sp. GY 10127]|uniref:M12 family metallo-peptidase n=1 Tax=Nocardioides sp. GY 10127 TaxID=2569762 RepID=UPI0010A85410|nr:M12 family metallo-peptidase [Nocardioides sp. GY 10127]